MKTVYVSIFALVLVLMSGMPFSSGGSAYAKYVSTKTQSQVNINNCSNDSNCAITSPQSQRDGSARSPINTQISNFNGELQGSVSSGEQINFTLTNCHVEPSSFNCDITNYVRGSYLTCLDNPFRCNVHYPHSDLKISVDCIVDSRIKPTNALCQFP
jgi:hypothetical protein